MGITAEAQAFILVIAAGLCTCIGAAVVFFPRLANLANRTTLAVSLGLAAGVMLYISLVDIYTKAVDGFAEDFDEGRAFIYASLSFFGGCFLMLFLNWCVDKLLQWEMKRSANDDNDETANTGTDPAAAVVGAYTAADADNPGEELERIKATFQAAEAARLTEEVTTTTTTRETSNADEEAESWDSDSDNPGASRKQQDGNKDVEGESTQKKDTATGQVNSTLLPGGELQPSVFNTTARDKSQPVRHMGFAMALAIAIHNFPEGMVTFITYVDDPAVGIALAIGIAVHNIPEGLCVAMPLFYATGRRWYSFWWATFSGLTEPIGALIAWLVLRGDMGGVANGILFGLVSGMMSIISIDELLPTAYKYARKHSTVTFSWMFGAFLISLSLMLFST